MRQHLSSHDRKELTHLKNNLRLDIEKIKPDLMKKDEIWNQIDSGNDVKHFIFNNLYYFRANDIDSCVEMIFKIKNIDFINIMDIQKDMFCKSKMCQDYICDNCVKEGTCFICGISFKNRSIFEVLMSSRCRLETHRIDEIPIHILKEYVKMKYIKELEN